MQKENIAKALKIPANHFVLYVKNAWAKKNWKSDRVLIR